MKNIEELLKEMISTSGLSGYETPIRKIIADAWEPLTDSLQTSRLGSLHGLKRGRGEEPRPSILIATHMDAIGLMVTRIVDGFLHITEIGGVDPRVLPGQPVTVHGREELPGLVVQPPAWLLPPDNQSGPVALSNLLVDTGLPEATVRRLVRPGDLVSFAQEPQDLGKDFVAGHSLDNRASVAALTRCLEDLQTRLHNWDVWAVATAQEEETLGGALTSAYELRPALAIAVDVSFGSGPGTSSDQTFNLGDGPILGWGPNIHPGVHKSLKEAAERLEMSTQFEVHARFSGTDAAGLQVAAEGIPTMVISIPLRYMHTPVEVVHLKDINRVGRLLAEFIAGLEPDFMESLAWVAE
jgi:endoglucanase